MYSQINILGCSLLELQAYLGQDKASYITMGIGDSDEKLNILHVQESAAVYVERMQQLYFLHIVSRLTFVLTCSYQNK